MTPKNPRPQSCAQDGPDSVEQVCLTCRYFSWGCEQYSGLWIFEVSKREQVHKILAEDPMKSTNSRWHNSRLTSPT